MSEVQLRARAAAAPVARAVTPDLALLGRLGWDDEVGVFRPDPAHPLLGYQVCRVGGCGNEATGREGLCNACSARRHQVLYGEASASVSSVGFPARRALRGATDSASAVTICGARVPKVSSVTSPATTPIRRRRRDRQSARAP